MDVDDQQENGGGELDVQIQQRERELESFSLSAAKRFAVKKELAMLRAKKIRLERANKSQR